MRRVFFAAALATALVYQSAPASAMTCVAYVRAVTGFDLSGNAWQWWNAAAGVYNRGHLPGPGAVMVFSRTRHMRDGHVAIDHDILGPREILIDQGNWEIVHHRRGAVSRDVHVIDVSPDNDWTMVRVQWQQSDVFGRDNPVSGFVYPDADSHANVSRARYLEARMRATESDDDGIDAEDATFTTPLSQGRHHHPVRCAATLDLSRHRLAITDMASWHVEEFSGTIGAARPR